MSSEQYSEKPLPPAGKKVCSYCGQVNAANTRMCWLCLERHSIQEGQPAPRRKRAALPQADIPPIGIAVWMLVLVMGGPVLIGALLIAPGLVFVALMVGVPLVAILALRERRSNDGDPVQTPSALSTAVGAIGVLGLLGIASFIAFFVICVMVNGINVR